MQKRELTLGYSPWGNGDSISPFGTIFKHKKDIKQHGLKDIDCLVLWGGTDIHPSFYGQKAHQYNHMKGMEPSVRDIFERKAVLLCQAKKIPIIGVCRGAQLLCALLGGSVIQDVQGHAGGSHAMELYDGRVVMTNSLHHQMMYPYDIKHELLAWSHYGRSSYYEEETVGVNKKEMFGKPEPEIVWFPQIQGLAIQGHPEGYGPPKEFIDVCNELVLKYMDFDTNPKAKSPFPSEAVSCQA